MIMGPNYKDSNHYAQKLEDLEQGDLDETYCFLYVPQDVSTFGAQGAAGLSQSSHKYADRGDNRM
jgi:hypothetical protein